MPFGPHSLGGLYRKQCLGIDGLRGEILGIGGIGTENFPEKVLWKSLGRTSVRTTKEPRATSGSIDHGAMHRWHHTVASLILGQLGDRFVCVKQCRYQRGEDESLSHPQTGASTATPRRSMGRRGAQPGSRPPRPALQTPHAEPDGGFLVLRPRGVDPVLPVAEVVSRSGTPPDSRVSMSGERQAPPTPRDASVASGQRNRSDGIRSLTASRPGPSTSAWRHGTGDAGMFRSTTARR